MKSTTPFLIAALIVVSAKLHAQSGATGFVRDSTMVSTDAAQSERVVREFVTAFDNRSAPAMLRLTSDDVAWMSAGIDSLVQVHVRGKQALGAQLQRQFAAMEAVKLTVASVSAVGPWIAAHVRGEQASKDTKSATMFLLVCEVRGGVIRRLWQYPPWTEASMVLR